MRMSKNNITLLCSCKKLIRSTTEVLQLQLTYVAGQVINVVVLLFFFLQCCLVFTYFTYALIGLCHF